MIRLCTPVVLILACVNLAGCQALAAAQARQAAQRQAIADNLRARIAELTPEQKNVVQKCASIAVGRIKALRNAGQGAGTYGVNDYTIVDSCINNQYYYETIPAPAIVINKTPYQRPHDGVLSSYQQCLAAQAAGAAVCP